MTAARVGAIVLMLSLVAGLPSLAFASPPDSTWFAGFWDNADHDESIILLTSAVGTVDATLAPDLGHVISVVLTLRPSKPALPEPSFRSPYHFRAPPLA